MSDKSRLISRTKVVCVFDLLVEGQTDTQHFFVHKSVIIDLDLLVRKDIDVL